MSSKINLQTCEYARKSSIFQDNQLISCKTEIFPRKLGRKIVEAEEIRHASDYDDFYIATREEAEEQIETGKQLLELIEEYIKRKLKDNNK